METPIFIKEATLLEDIPLRDTDSGRIKPTRIALDRQNPEHVTVVREIQRIIKLRSVANNIKTPLVAGEAMDGRLLVLFLGNESSFSEMLTIDRNRELTRPTMDTYPRAGDTVNIVLGVAIYHRSFIGLTAKVIQFVGR